MLRNMSRKNFATKLYNSNNLWFKRTKLDTLCEGTWVWDLVHIVDCSFNGAMVVWLKFNHSMQTKVGPK